MQHGLGDYLFRPSTHIICCVSGSMKGTFPQSATDHQYSCCWLVVKKVTPGLYKFSSDNIRGLHGNQRGTQINAVKVAVLTLACACMVVRVCMHLRVCVAEISTTGLSSISGPVSDYSHLWYQIRGLWLSL